MAFALLLVAALGMAARPTAPRRTHALDGTALGVVAMGLAVVQMGLLVWLVLSGRRWRRRRDDENERLPQPVPMSRWARPTALLGVLAMLVVPWVVLVAIGRRTGAGGNAVVPRRPVSSPVPTADASPAPRIPSGHHVASAQETGWLLWILALSAVVVVSVVVGFLWSHGWRNVHVEGAPGRRGARSGLLTPAVDGTAAPTGDRSDPRQAVIACWSVLRDEAARRGARPSPADTPERLLRRAGDVGLAGGEAGPRLAGLFREARFSTHPITEEHRVRAEDALRRITRHHADVDVDGHDAL
ncbi:DUF4129 domain-containing protein [Streptomyces sp. PTM05]|uniref:DUF4129 domain-containing protein n=1 Tax=Streptantibioticus parmotrematis TaxID=2873249 RepID=A0ABS7R1D9_9ACTN|nr:DUF4129 domain-containing protein [Streptantibioticus parmotrematis]MBY8889267.1 DUF4129 domain-containing protein [Streptantibioticus parmotrematis]